LERDKLLAILAAYGPAADTMDDASPNPAMAKAAACEPESIEDEAVELDTTVMDNWQSFFSPEEFIDLVTTQVADARVSLQKLKDAAAAGDQIELRAWAHNLKSGCGALGLIRVQAIAMKLEHACREGRSKEALAMVPSLVEVIGIGMTVFEARYAEYIQEDQDNA
jgi:HPt (histidine-containing phosphotransfer) domain-containing protein